VDHGEYRKPERLPFSENPYSLFLHVFAIVSAVGLILFSNSNRQAPGIKRKKGRKDQQSPPHPLKKTEWNPFNKKAANHSTFSSEQ
jgi:hypothetical protein